MKPILLQLRTHKRLQYFLLNSGRLCEISNHNQTLHEKVFEKQAEQYASSIQELEKKLNDSEENLEKVVENFHYYLLKVDKKDEINKNLTMKIKSLSEQLKSEKDCSTEHKQILLEERKRNEEKINVYKNNENRFKSRIRHLENEVLEITKKLVQTKNEMEKFRESEVLHRLGI